MSFLGRGNNFSHSEIFLGLKNPALINSDENILWRMMKSYAVVRYKIIYRFLTILLGRNLYISLSFFKVGSNILGSINCIDLIIPIQVSICSVDNCVMSSLLFNIFRRLSRCSFFTTKRCFLSIQTPVTCLYLEHLKFLSFSGCNSRPTLVNSASTKGINFLETFDF